MRVSCFMYTVKGKAVRLRKQFQKTHICCSSCTNTCRTTLHQVCHIF